MEDDFGSQMEEEGEMDMMDMVGEEGEESMDEDEKLAGDIQDESGDEPQLEGEEQDDDEFASDEDVIDTAKMQALEEGDETIPDDIDTNIESKRDKVISDLLKKEDLGLIQMRLKENIKILSNFKELRQGEKSRSEYLQDVMSDICQAYDYNRSLVELIFDLFAPSEALEFIEANENARPLTIRTNTLKTKRKDLAKVLIQRGV